MAGYTSFIMTNSEREMSLSWVEMCVCLCVCITPLSPLGMLLYKITVLCVRVCVLEISTNVLCVHVPLSVYMLTFFSLSLSILSLA